jgi:hypothetical protein
VFTAGRAPVPAAQVLAALRLDAAEVRARLQAGTPLLGS